MSEATYTGRPLNPAGDRRVNKRSSKAITREHIVKASESAVALLDRPRFPEPAGKGTKACARRREVVLDAGSRLLDAEGSAAPGSAVQANHFFTSTVEC